MADGPNREHLENIGPARYGRGMDATTSPPLPMVRIIGRIVDDGVVELKTAWPATQVAADVEAPQHAPRDQD